MFSRIAVATKVGTVGSRTTDPARARPRIGALLLLSAWCGLVAGLLEVSAIVLRKLVLDSDHLYRMSHHFVWLIPLVNFCVFLVLGVLGCGTILLAPRRGRWLFTRGLCALVVLPSLLVALPRVYGLAWLVVALGMATQLVPLIERRGPLLRRSFMFGFPAAIAAVTILAASQWVGDRITEKRESARPLPPLGSPNVLLIVLDTVAAGHLNLHGYHRPTSTTLVELAERGVRFDSARAASSWTLPSHASMFTGRWLHELSVGWFTPLDHACPTLAEFLGERGYATGGFVGNTFFCAADSGLARGFTHYQDFIFPELTALKTAVMVRRTLDGFQTVVSALAEDWLMPAAILPYFERFWQSLDTDRKGAAVVNREFLEWLSRRPEPKRPFFAFLNYFDAHYPYRLLPGRLHRFGVEPANKYERALIQRWWGFDKKTVSPEGVAFVTDAYDDCIADLDEQLGKLVDELDRRAVLEQTWLIIVSDHGESFGEHSGVFCHGLSLYDTELHVPLLIVPPGGKATKRVVEEPVSLRDLAATIVDVAGQGAGSTFPGNSLARFWDETSSTVRRRRTPAELTLAEVVPNASAPGNLDSSGLPKATWPLGAMKDAEWSYIRREGDIREELFNLRDDAKEQRDLAGDPAARATLEHMRAALDHLTGGPLSPQRFSR
jgi:arylsulfatase A-like enzyme